MRIATIPAAAMIVVGLTFAPAFAGQHGHSTTPHGGGPKATHATPTTTTTAPHSTAVSTTPTATTASTTATTITTRSHGNKHDTPTSTTLTTTNTTPTTTNTTPTTTNTTPTTTTTRGHGNKHTTSTTTPTTTATNPIATKISSHPQQAARIERMLPKGMTLATASKGFKNQGQFIAALHVSQNLNIPFTDLRRAMTGPDSMSLGQAIHTLRPSVDATAAERSARTQTATDVR